MMTIAFIGIGHMGFPMACNLAKAGHTVIAYDICTPALEAIAKEGIFSAKTLADAVSVADVIISMLPEGEHVRTAYLEPTGIFALAKRDALFIESSTIDVVTAKMLHIEAARQGLALIDAPVSGGTTGAAAATLTFMVGGSTENFERAKPMLETMGKNIFHAGEAGCGQIAKMCNNLILGISMTAVSEAFSLAKKLGLDAHKFFEICANASGQCWSLTQYCPVPTILPHTPASHNYEPGFMAKMMLKDLQLAEQAALQSHTSIPLGAQAAALYQLLCNQGFAEKDFSFIYKFLSEKLSD